MQTSVRQMAPRLVSGNALENNKIHVSQEVLVTTSQSELPAQSNEGSVTTSAVANNRRGDVSARTPGHRYGLSDGAMGIASTAPGHVRLASKDLPRLERDRQDLRELSAFLRTKDPPPDNYMSIPENFDDPTDISGNSLLKIFRRKSSKKSMKSTPRHLRLPDSAVASKTISGHWHISISIPLEYDHPDTPPLPKPSFPQAIVVPPPQVQPLSPPITVLKPTAQSSDQNAPKPDPLSIEAFTPTQNVVGSEALTTPQNHHRQGKMKEKPMAQVPTRASGAEASRPERVYVPVSSGFGRSESQRTDPRHSGGTAYSERSLDSEHGHSRQVSSVSTVGSSNHVTPQRGVEPPLRYSSKLKGVDGGLVEASPAKIPLSASDTADENLDPQSRYSYLSGKSDDTEPSSATVNIADVAKGYGTSDQSRSDIRLVRNTPRQLGAAPTRKLPDLPEGSDDGRSVKARSSNVQANTSSALSSPTRLSENGPATPRQSRQERVKALRQRDIQAFTSKAAMAHQDPRNVTPTRSTVKPQTNDVILRSSKRRALSNSPTLGSSRHTDGNRLTSIMVVANLEPYSGPVDLEKYIFSPARRSTLRQAKSSPANGGFRRTHTPPRSVTPSLASSDEQTIRNPKPEARKQIARGIAKQEEELDARLKKIERSNALMLQTLNAVVAMGTGFQELNRLMPMTGQPGSAGNTELQQGTTPQVGKGLDSIEPLMRELQMASRISQESERVAKDDEDDMESLFA